MSLSYNFFAILAYAQSPVTWVVAVFGAMIGSFLNVCIYRIPEGTFWSHARSVCRSCGKPVASYDNIPVLSWFILRGKTRCCKQPLSWQYPSVEAFTALLFVVVYWKFPFLADFSGASNAGGVGTLPWIGLRFDHAEALRAFHAAFFGCLMIICSVIDLRLMIIPDAISIPMVLATPLIVLIHPDLDWLSAAIGVLAGGGILYAIAWIYWFARREVGLGMGDVKLLAGIGGWLGYQAILPTIFYGSIVGAVFGIVAIAITAWRKNEAFSLRTAIPFGPFLALGAMMHLLIGFRLKMFLMGE